jgi:hypothetical protein
MIACSSSSSSSSKLEPVLSRIPLLRQSVYPEWSETIRKLRMTFRVAGGAGVVKPKRGTIPVSI